MYACAWFGPTKDEYLNPATTNSQSGLLGSWVVIGDQ